MSQTMRPNTVAAPRDPIQYPFMRIIQKIHPLLTSSLRYRICEEEAHGSSVQHTNLPFDEEIARVRCQRLVLKFGLVRSSRVYACHAVTGQSWMSRILYLYRLSVNTFLCCQEYGNKYNNNLVSTA